MNHRHHNGHDKFERELVAHVEDVQGMLEQQQAAMRQEWANLDQGWADLEEKMSAVGMSMKIPNTPDPILLNVGGADVCVPRNILEELQKSSAAWTRGDLFRGGEWDRRLLRDSDGQVFVDVSPACCEHLICKLSGMFGRAGARPDLAVGDLPADELPHMPYVASALGLSPLMKPPTGMSLIGGSTIIEANEADALTATIQSWCPGKPGGLEIMYRASGDGWSSRAL